MTIDGDQLMRLPQIGNDLRIGRRGRHDAVNRALNDNRPPRPVGYLPAFLRFAPQDGEYKYYRNKYKFFHISSAYNTITRVLSMEKSFRIFLFLALDKVFQPCYGVRVYFKGSGVKSPRYPVTVIGKILSRNFSSQRPLGNREG
jgi:hypothetical protein